MSVVTNWDHPLFVVIGSTKHAVRNATDASWLLADRWPVLAGEPFMQALKACAAEREGKPGKCARTAFIAAARDAEFEVRGLSIGDIATDTARVALAGENISRTVRHAV